MILAGTVTGVQGDIRWKVLAAYSTVNNLSWNWPDNRRKYVLGSCYLLFVQYTLMRFSTCVTGSSLAQVLKTENARISK